MTHKVDPDTRRAIAPAAIAMIVFTAVVSACALYSVIMAVFH